MDGYIGMVMLWAGFYCPRNWMYCRGQTLQIQDYQALYAQLGVTYGGDGRMTFKLPDLSGRIAVGSGSNHQETYVRGQFGGVANNQIQLSKENLPDQILNIPGVMITIPPISFNLDVSVNSNVGEIATPVDGNYFAVPNSGGRAINSFSNDLPQDKLKKLNGGQVDIPSQAVSTDLKGIIPGGNVPIGLDNHQPYFTLDYIICVEGMWPERD